jgi:hypothetical protein
MSENLRGHWRSVVISKSRPSLKTENGGQRGRNKKHVAEMLVKE